MLTRVGRPPRPSPIVLAGYVAYMAVGWFMIGLGSALPDLEQQIGERASIYPLLPGAVLLVWGAIVVRRHRDAEPPAPHTTTLVTFSITLGFSVLVMGVTRWFGVSAVGAVAAAVSAAALIRLMPALLAVARPHDTERVMMRANAWSSLAGIVAPLAVGGSIAIGGGWLAGMGLPVGAGVIAIVVLTSRAPDVSAPSGVHDHDQPVVPPFTVWWREFTVLTLCIVVEFCFTYFAATFLHDQVGMSTAAAAAGAAAWGIGMAGGRFVVSVVPPPRSILPSVALIAIGFVLFWGVATPVASIAALGIAGLGASPLYPTRITALMQRFPRSPDQGAARGSLASGTALLAAPAVMAGLRAISDVRTAYLAVPILLAILAALARPTTQPAAPPASPPASPPARIG